MKILDKFVVAAKPPDESTPGQGRPIELPDVVPWIALIGRLPSTLDDRSLHVEIKRKTAAEKVAPFRLGRIPDLDELTRKAARWAADNVEALRGSDPKMPLGVENRAADNWEPLFAIADLVGERWAKEIRSIAIEACSAKKDDSQNIRLLADIRGMLREYTEATKATNISSVDLGSNLVSIPDRGWNECNRGKPLTQNGLSRKLKPFGIQSKTVRIGNFTAKG